VGCLGVSFGIEKLGWWMEGLGRCGKGEEGDGCVEKKGLLGAVGGERNGIACGHWEGDEVGGALELWGGSVAGMMGCCGKLCVGCKTRWNGKLHVCIPGCNVINSPILTQLGMGDFHELALRA
jgi:hypothetical protein